MKLVYPTLAYKEKAIEYMNEFYEHGSQINGAGGLNRFLKESTYEEWIEYVRSEMDIANLPEEKVPALTYFFVREEDDRIIGMTNIRLSLNDFLRSEGGHIGYAIRPTERRKHYAIEQLKAALAVYRRVGIEEVLVSCYKDNVASAGVIQKCGGILQREFFSENCNKMMQMYVISNRI